MHYNILADFPQNRGQGKRRTNRIAVRAFVGRQQERLVAAYLINDVLYRLRHALCLSP